MPRFINLLSLLFFSGLLFPNSTFATDERLEEGRLVALRVIGHELLITYGDTASRVLPIAKENGKYIVAFESTFSFVPDQLTYIIDSIFERSKAATKYIVEVRTCDSAKVVYSFAVDKSAENNLVSCTGRLQPVGCYVLQVRIDAPLESIDDSMSNSTFLHKDRDNLLGFLSFYFFLGIALSLLFSFIIAKRLKKRVKHTRNIGSYIFDSKHMTLTKGKATQALTGKETDLLKYLCSHANSTVEKDTLLSSVWQDDGVYNGRTLDVYISKLRKKLESDPSVSIVNIRGIGYKLTLS